MMRQAGSMRSRGALQYARSMLYPQSLRSVAVPQRGFGLIELMVAMVIGLVASLAIFQTFSASEERKRTTTSGSEGLQSAIFALGYLERMVGNAGYGMVAVSDPTFRSVTRIIDVAAGSFSLSSARPPVPEFSVGCRAAVNGVNTRIAPIIVTSGGGALVSDTITVMAANTATVPMPVATIPVGVNLGISSIVVRSTYGYAVGDWVLVYEQSNAAAVNPGVLRPVACTMARIVALPDAPNVSSARINLDRPIAQALSVGAVSNLGQAPNITRIGVDANSRLTALDLLTPGATAQVIAENVIAMKVQVGVDVGGDDIIDRWMNPPVAEATWTNPMNPPPDFAISALPVAVAPPAIHQAKALRIGVLVRSPQFERPDASGNCVTSPAGPFDVLPAKAGAAAQRIADMPTSGAYTLAGDQRCFRYNTVSALVPLRNQLMSEM